MYARIITFRLDGVTVEEHAPAAAAIAPNFAAWPGLITKFWIHDADQATLGGVYIFADREAADRSQQTPEFAAVTNNPTFADVHIREFDVLDELTAITAGPFASILDATHAGATRAEHS